MSYYDDEAIEDERFDADMLQAHYEAEGNRAWKTQQKVNEALRNQDYELATSLCDHGHIGKLDGECSKNDPLYMQEGYRCYSCGGVVTEMRGTVLHVK